MAEQRTKCARQQPQTAPTGGINDKINQILRATNQTARFYRIKKTADSLWIDDCFPSTFMKHNPKCSRNVSIVPATDSGRRQQADGPKRTKGSNSNKITTFPLCFTLANSLNLVLLAAIPEWFAITKFPMASRRALPDEPGNYYNYHYI